MKVSIACGSLLIVCACLLARSVSALNSAPSPTPWFYAYLNQNSTAARNNQTVVNIGQLVTIACAYTYLDGETDANTVVDVSIGKRHPLKSEQVLILLKNGEIDRDFSPMWSTSALKQRYLPAGRVKEGKLLTDMLNIIDFQPEDAGDFVCKVSVSGRNARNLFANFSLKLAPSVYAVDIVRQQMVFKPSEPLTVNCTFYRSDLIDQWKVRFEVCFLRPDVYQRNPDCVSGVDAGRIAAPSVYSTVAMPYSDIWQRTVIREEISATISARDLNSSTSIGCFVYNKPTRAWLRDYVTLVTVEGDLTINPFNFNCSQSRVVARPGDTVTFECNVTYSTFRVPSLGWEIWQPSGKISCSGSAANCAEKKVRISESQLEAAEVQVDGRYEQVRRNRLEVTCDSALKSWKFTALEIYPEHTHRSVIFSVDCSSDSPPAVIRRANASATQTSVSMAMASLCLLLSVASKSLFIN